MAIDAMLPSVQRPTIQNGAPGVGILRVLLHASHRTLTAPP
jgi:hypothetical protein